MRVFVTGATGFIGSAVVDNLLAAGHQVLGLARTDAAAAQLAERGAAAHHGSLQDLGSLQAGADACDGVIHTAFIHDFGDYQANCEIDRHAIAAMAQALRGSARRLVVTSGTIVAGGKVALESQAAPQTGAVPRAASEAAAAQAVAEGADVVLVRLPPSVHDAGDHGFVPHLIRLARERGVSAYIGDGFNRWPAVHRRDAAALFRLALERGQRGARYHGAADSGVPFRDIASLIGRHLQVPVKALQDDAVHGHFGWFAHFAGVDNPCSSTWTRAQLGWQPTHPGLLTDLDQPHYFQD
ncbi:SDR family oxidoreductase [Pseudoxanthomonas composti]|uniref:SDR family oxidoreductase n=1 Tax=Pseudoxanthomonas composti TaxID=2137479 RepID=A0A4Q1K1V0_9GAMM|nr:SDR family oxidoreductase [Pseudoxanthomonas composti]RXR08566.1 SDR family oxidoreductase [Pseudoxanthomonas composti]